MFCLQVIIYEITRLKMRHSRLREVLLPAQAQSLDVLSEGRLCVGYQSGFTIYSLMGDQHPLSLVHPDNQNLGFLAYSPIDALGAIELPRYARSGCVGRVLSSDICGRNSYKPDGVPC